MSLHALTVFTVSRKEVSRKYQWAGFSQLHLSLCERAYIFFLSGYFKENVIKNGHPRESNDCTSINGCMKGLRNFPKNLQKNGTNLECCSKRGQNSKYLLVL